MHGCLFDFLMNDPAAFGDDRVSAGLGITGRREESCFLRWWSLKLYLCVIEVCFVSFSDCYFF